MAVVHLLASAIAFAILGAAALYAVLALTAVLVWKRQRIDRATGDDRATADRPSCSRPPVTILKPLCGAEPGLYEHLRTFCRQQYPDYQIVFGVRDTNDPACAVVERLIAEFPSLPIDFVVDPNLHGNNYKTSNLMNMLPHARHDFLVMADSDASVGPDYLVAVTAPLRDPGVGLVTCLYHGVPTPLIWSRLGAMYINEWYMPAILLAWLFGHQGYTSGQTLCVRRDTLLLIGGLEAVESQLAEDYRLGQLVRDLGLRIVLSRYMVEGEHHEANLDSLSRHELRWMRTIRIMRPRSFRFIFISFNLPVAAIGLAVWSVASSVSMLAWALFGVTVIARLGLHFMHRLRDARSVLADVWLLPVREVLICWVWIRSFLSSRVTWRGNEFAVDTAGFLRKLS
jgi:ceramide glucosyltransferase